MTEPLRVVIADDERLVRAGFRALIDAEPGMIVVGEAADGAAAVELARQTRPDVILMDIRMPGMDGLNATRQIAEDPDLAHVHVRHPAGRAATPRRRAALRIRRDPAAHLDRIGSRPEAQR